MNAESWIRKISENDRSEKVLRLTDAKARIPGTAYIDGVAPDPNIAHPTLSPIEISWAGKKPTKHFVRKTTNPHMITDRSDAVGAFYAGLASSITHIVITSIEDGKFLVTPLQNP